MSDPVKIVVITHNYIRREGDLTALYLHRLASGLIAKGFEVTVVCPYAPGLLREDEIDGVKIKRFDYFCSRSRPLVYTGNMHQEVAGSIWAKVVFVGFLISFYRFALNVCRETDPDLIWANWWIPPGLVASRIARKLRIPLVISSHGTDISLLRKSGLIGFLSKFVYSRTRRATVVSSFLKSKLCKNVGSIPADNVAVIPMPVGMAYFPRTDLPDNHAPVILSVARFSRQKRLDNILAAARRIASEGIGFKIILVGEGPLENDLRTLIEKYNLTERVEMIPLVAQQKLGELYRQADAVILASENEGFGLVLVEAGLTGRPVIASRSGGITDVIVHDKNGLLFDVGNIDQLTDCLRSIITDPALRQRLSDGGYQIASEKFSTPVLVEKVHDLFLKTVAEFRENSQ